MSNDDWSLPAACLIVRHEERNIGRCLGSLDGLVDRISLAHTPCGASTHGTATSRTHLKPSQGRTPHPSSGSAVRSQTASPASG